MLVIPINTYSQEKLLQPINLHYMPVGNVIESLGNIGGKSTKSIITEIGASNPASISDFSTRSLGISYQYDTKIKEAWILDIGHGRLFDYIPQSFGIVFPFENWRFGISMNQIYNTEIDYGELDPTMVWNNPQGYISTKRLRPLRIEQVLKNSIIVNYNIGNLLHNCDNLKLGLQVNYNYLILEEILSDEHTLEETSCAINFTPGIIYEFEVHSNLFTRFGFYYESKIDLSKTFIYSLTKLRLISFFPEKFHYGFQSELSSKYFIAGTVSYYLWEELEDYLPIRNQIELRGYIGYKVDDNLKFNLGIFSTDRKYDYENGVYDYDKLCATYLILSANYKMNDVSFDFTIADSHAWSDKWRKQTIIKIGTGYEL